MAKPRIIRRSRHHRATPCIICRRQTSFKKRIFVGRQKCVFCWCGRRDCDSRRELRALVVRRENSSTGRVFYTAPTSSPTTLIKQKSRATRTLPFCWCGRRDLNPYVGNTRPSNVRVCRFRHSREHWYYITVKIKCQ